MAKQYSCRGVKRPLQQRLLLLLNIRSYSDIHRNCNKVNFTALLYASNEAFNTIFKLQRSHQDNLSTELSFYVVV